MIDLSWIFYIVPFCILFFLPLKLFNIFAVPQTLALATLSGLGMCLGVVSGVISLSAPSALILLFFIYMTLAFMWMQPIHNAKKEYGLQAPLLLLFLLGAAHLNYYNSSFVMAAFSIVVFLECIYGYLQTRMIDPFFPNKVKGGGPKNNPIGTIGNPNFYGAFLTIGFWMSIYSAVTLHYVFVVISLFALFMIYKAHNRAGLLGIVVSTFFFLVVTSYYGMIPETLQIGKILIPVWNNLLFTYLSGIIVIVAPFVVFYLFKKNWYAFWHRPTALGPDVPNKWYTTLRYRFCYWLAAWELIKERPIFGWGLWSYRKEVYRAQAKIHHDKWDKFLQYNRYVTPQPRECHNDFIEHLVEYGLVGFCIFMGFLSSVYYIGFSVLSGPMFWPMLLLLCSLTALLTNAFFFFPLRLPPTAIAFWVLCAMIVGIGGVNLIVVNFPWYMPIIVGFFMLALLWECVIKRTITSYYYNKSRISPNMEVRSKALEKALLWAPNETLLRTHAALGIVDFDPTTANIHAMRMITDFDGMSPYWVAMFNAAIIRARTTNMFDEATIYLHQSFYVNPYFQHTKNLLMSVDGIGIRSRYRGGERNMVLGNETTMYKMKTFRVQQESVMKDKILIEQGINAIEKELQKRGNSLSANQKENLNLKKAVNLAHLEGVHLKMELINANIVIVVLEEKKRLNIPDNWVYDEKDGMFVDPAEAERRKLLPENMMPTMPEAPQDKQLKETEQPKTTE